MSLNPIPSDTAAISPSRSFLPSSVGCFAGPSPAHRDRLISGGGHVDSSPRIMIVQRRRQRPTRGNETFPLLTQPSPVPLASSTSSASFNCMSDSAKFALLSLFQRIHNAICGLQKPRATRGNYQASDGASVPNVTLPHPTSEFSLDTVLGVSVCGVISFTQLLTRCGPAFRLPGHQVTLEIAKTTLTPAREAHC